MAPSASLSFVARGVFPALLTPLTDDGERIDAAALRAHVAWLIDHGVHGLMPAGSTGEGPLLTTAERQQLLEVVVDAAAGRVPVLAHVGAITTRETIALVRHARGCGAQAASVVTPYYFRVPDEALIAHACRVAEAAPDLPIFLYNIPQNTGNTLSSAVVEAIVARCPNVVGLKDGSDDRDALVRFTMASGGRFQALSDALRRAPAGASPAPPTFPLRSWSASSRRSRAATWPARAPIRSSSTRCEQPWAMVATCRCTNACSNGAACAAARRAHRCRRPPTRWWSKRSLICGHIIY